MYRTALLALLLLVCESGFAQSARQRRDSLRVTIAAMKADLARIDSTGPAARAVEARIKLAALLKGKEAIRVLDQAATMADSAREAQLGIDARTGLIERYRAVGDHKRALAEALRIIEIERNESASNVERQAAEASGINRLHQQERDSLIAVREQEASAALITMGQAQKAIVTRERLDRSNGRSWHPAGGVDHRPPSTRSTPRATTDAARNGRAAGPRR
ncbi:MAG: hypothetical protein IPM46_01695 [Flavobacteriales bacterium]|nr:hypothetical protein [Flavobacteriales bacterium]